MKLVSDSIQHSPQMYFPTLKFFLSPIQIGIYRY